MEYRRLLAEKSNGELIDMVMRTRRGTVVVDRGLRRRIALRICYDGREYAGLVCQENEKTIEDFLKYALTNSGLASPDVQITFAGRTDRGVSASEMVLSVLCNSLGLEDATNAHATTMRRNTEFNYDTILNTHLPQDIRVTGWCSVPVDFCARNSCKLRRYKYFFLPESLDVAKMRQACAIIKKGTHFGNLCRALTKKEAAKVADMEKHFHRPMNDIQIENHDEFCVVEVSSRSFLHNMIRKIFWVLKEVGLGRQDLDFVDTVLGKAPIMCGTERPEFLVFAGAEYEPGLVFRCNEKNATTAYNRLVENAVQREVIKGLRMAKG